MYKIQDIGRGYTLSDESGFIRFENFIGHCLEWIIVKEGLDVSGCISESHALAILREEGVEIELLEEDGSEMTW